MLGRNHFHDRIRRLVVKACIGLCFLGWFAFACNSPVSGPCGVCSEGTECNLRLKRCIQKKQRGCDPCENDQECANGERCSGDGCCLASGQKPLSDGGLTDLTPVGGDRGCLGPDCGSASSSCISSDDCIDPKLPYCHPDQKSCVSCVFDTHCAKSQVCAKDRCGYPDLCKKVNCASGKRCDPRKGTCVDDGKCPQVSCPFGQCCTEKGSCKPCGAKQLCQECTTHVECGEGNRCVDMGGQKACSKGCPDDQCPDGFQCFSMFLVDFY